jgi:hypothetical protein
MTNFKSSLNSIPPSMHGILEFAFFVAVGITAGNMGWV